LAQASLAQTLASQAAAAAGEGHLLARSPEMGGQCSVPETAHALAKQVETGVIAWQWRPKGEVRNPPGNARVRPGRARAGSLLLATEGLGARCCLSQRSLKLELLACLYHQGKNLVSVYEYTTTPPTVVGSGFSGDVVLCRRRERAAVRQNSETAVRCVKKFDLQRMSLDNLAKLKNEATIYLSLEHPAIARLFDVFEDDREVSLVMQYCSGGTLEHALRSQGAFEEQAFKEHAVPMLSAVNYIHRAGIVHRDIKPRNWVHEADGVTVKLIDFGFSAKQFLSAEHSDTLQGCMGTLGYLAPEVVRAGLADSAAYGAGCDVWSLGVVFLELLTGEPAFHRDSGFCEGYTEEVVQREILDVTADVVERHLASAPGAPRPLLRRLLTPDPDGRPSAESALRDPYLEQPIAQLQQPAKALPMGVVLDRFRAHGLASKPSRAWLQALARSPTHLPWGEFCVLRNTFKMFDARGGFRGTVDLAAFCSTVLGSSPPPSPEASPSAPSRCGGGEDTCDLQAVPELETEDDEAYWDSYASLEGGAAHSPRASAPGPQVEKHRGSPLGLSAVEVGSIWRRVCGEQESLSYCEFLAVLLPPIEDVFEDATPAGRPGYPGADPFGLSPQVAEWKVDEPVSCFLQLLRGGARQNKVPVFTEGERVQDVVKTMTGEHHRWAVVRFRDGRHAFFDYMDVNRELVQLCDRARDGERPSAFLAALAAKTVGEIANRSGFSAFVPCVASTPLRRVLKLLSAPAAAAGLGRRGSRQCPVRRVPIMDQQGRVVHVFSCTDFLELAMRFPGPSSVLKQHAAEKFDRRDSILELSALHDGPFMDALRTMDTHSLPTCPVTSHSLSGDMGGVVASNVVSVTDLKWVIGSGDFHLLDGSLSAFVTWRSGIVDSHLDEIIRQQRLNRFKVVSVQVCDSLYHLSQRLLASKLLRVFLSSDDIARIVGIVGSRDILVEVISDLI